MRVLRRNRRRRAQRQLVEQGGDAAPEGPQVDQRPLAVAQEGLALACLADRGKEEGQEGPQQHGVEHVICHAVQWVPGAAQVVVGLQEQEAQPLDGVQAE